MKIVIAGAGDVGFHLARLLSSENQEITLIDKDQEVLDYASNHLDVLTLRGDAASFEILKETQIFKARLFLAVTTSEKTNLLAAVLAKRLGAKKTIARIDSTDYLKADQRELLAELGVDTLISPSLLAAMEIKRLVNQCSFTDIFEFEEGKISVVGVTLTGDSLLTHQRIGELNKLEPTNGLRPISILRGSQTFLPKGDIRLRPNDHVYFIGKKERVKDFEQSLGYGSRKVSRIMILGGTALGYESARLLEPHYQVTLVESDKERCKELADALEKTLIIHGEPSNLDLLMEEGLEHMDVFIALTENAEVNIISSLSAKNQGVQRTIAQVENKEYTHISQEIGVDTLINKRLIAANNIFRFVRKGRVEAITSLHGVDAEIIEFVVEKDNQLTHKPIRELPFPEKAVIGSVIRGDQALTPDGDFQIEVQDKVIVFAMPEAINKLETLFR